MRRSALALIPLVTGCYTFTLIDPSTAQLGSDVRAHVSPSAVERLTPLLGRVENRLVTGTLIENGATSVVMEVPQIIPQSPGAVQTLNQRVSIARSDIVGLETRTLDKARTGLVVGGVAVVVVVAAIKSLTGQSSTGGTVPGGGSELRVPLFRFAP